MSMRKPQWFALQASQTEDASRRRLGAPQMFAASLWILCALTFSVAAQALPEPTPPVGMMAEDPAVDGVEWRHAVTLGEAPPRYDEGFAHFEYVNPDAAKGGRVRLADIGSFDSLNFVPPRGETPRGLNLIYDTLMTDSLDELSTQYGLIAEAMHYPEDYSSVTFRLRGDARWHDGVPVTAADVVFSFNALVEHNPSQRAYYSHVEAVEIPRRGEVKFLFDEVGNRELPYIVGQLIVMPQHWWAGTDASGNARDISRGTLEPPLGSGPYRIADVIAGRTIEYERVADYWAADLNVNVGQHNFERMEYDFYRDGDVAFEAFKADEFDWRTENRARNWATGYDIPAVAEGRIILEEFEEPFRRRGLMVGFVFNTQRPVFANRNVRRGFSYMLDFQELNRSLFFGSYTQYQSYFTGVESLMATGLPEGQELAILETVRQAGHDIPDDVFTTPYSLPVNDSPETRRETIRQALELFEAGGWAVREEVDAEQAGEGLVHSALVAIGLRSDPTRRVMRDEAGDPVQVELLLNGPTQEPAANQLAQSLELVGIELVVRTVDSSQYTNRVRAKDYDLIYTGWAQATSPGNEQEDYWGSVSATVDGSRNHAGIENPAIDALIENIKFAENRETLEAATRAMDRVLLWNHYVVPGWGQGFARVARWDRFSHPQTLPTYAIGFPTIWWWDAEKAARTGEPAT
ncbi:MAG: extracellular solute-binding protein [Pseudomonadota bacterium]